MGFTALIAGGIGAAGSIGSALIGSNASQNASNQQVAMQQQALAQQKALYNQGLSTATGALQPFVNAGQSVLPTLQGLITPGPNQNALLSQTPGFQFAQQYGTMAATNALAAKSGASAGPLAAAISQYNTGLAQNTWQSTVQALQGYAGIGANAAGTLGTAALGAGVNEGNSQASTLTGIGNSQAAGTLGSANALTSGVNGVAGAGGNALNSAAIYSYLQNGGAGGSGLYSNPSYGGGNAFSGDAYGGSASNPLPGLTSADYAAKGGHTSGKSKRPIVVGENGPELFVPDQAGTIVPYERVKKAIKDKNCLSTRGLTRKLGEAA